LASINNLILANKAGKKHPQKVSQKVNEHLWLDRSKIFAAVVRDGEAKEIVDEEFDIIQQGQIDSVSRVINEEFDFLYQLDSEDDARL
jgi:uncharacterized protein YjgD (DUF1641 family)